METRVDPQKISKTIKMLGFDNMQHTECRGYAGGIVVAWKSSEVYISVDIFDFQFMHLTINFLNGPSWNFTAVYASPREENRNEAWQKLKTISQNVNGGWMMAGDFNDIISQDEKKGGAPFSTRRCNNFQDNINACGLIDLGAVGPKYTWRGPLIGGQDRIFERLDRALSNDEWRLLFSEAIVKVLPRIEFSDHHPIIIMLHGIPVAKQQGKFRFEKAWMFHPTYTEFVKGHWQAKTTLPERVNHMADEFGKWKKNVFGNIYIQKSDLMARINGIQRKLHTDRHNKFLERLEQQLQRELDTVLQQEEAMWFQKSRSQWIKDGDRNTRYYHVKAITRRRRNKILMLKNDQNIWVENEEELKLMVNDYYKSLFARPDHNIQWHQTRYSYPGIGEEEYDALKRNITNIEVKNALFAMAPWKAPGPDGFPAGFYQNGWRYVERSLCEFVKSVWHNPVSVATVNLTDICLIPKNNRPEFVSQFRPISLCNVSYKIITKVVVNRLKQIVPKVVSPFQTGFVPGRNITENIVIAQEMLHTMTKMRSKLGFFVIKVDLSKAYDRLSWEFIYQVLLEIKIPDEMINVIMHCVTSVKSNVLWNGSRSDFFTPQCGVRQGDPMSPYLFVLCMDKLSHLIAEAIEEGRWKPMRAGKNGPPISHLMFVDDLLLFGQATGENMTAVMEVLNQFCTMSGQQVNYDKSAIFFSRNVAAVRRVTLSTKSGLKETMNLGNYLGVPALGRSPRIHDFQYLIEKVKTRLAGWKAKQLSLAGRITLAKSVIQAIPIYPMMSMPIPISCLNEIEKIQRAFIWGDTEDKRKAHMVSWETITKPKSNGGLGFRKLQGMNQACLMKMGWSLMVEEQSLWGEVLLGKYGRDSWNQGLVTVTPNDSALWKAIAKVWPLLEQHKCWSLGDGSKVNFWHDKWINEHLRISDLVSNIPEESREWTAHDVSTGDGRWNLNLLNSLVPDSIIQKMHAIVPPHTSYGDDIKLWPGNRAGSFTVSAAYQLITLETTDIVDRTWNSVWKIDCIERIKVFMWQLIHDRLLTKAKLAKWHVSDPFCARCIQFEESVIHVIRDCLIAVEVWRHLVSSQERGNFFVVSRQDWITMNLNNQFGKAYGNDWTAIWATTCYLLWQWRNKSMHDDDFVSPLRPWQVVIEYVKAYKKSMLAEKQTKHEREQQQINVNWRAPMTGWCVLNTDGAAKIGTGKAGCGGVLRNDAGVWMEGFVKGLGDTTAYMAELWGIYEGLRLARRRGVLKLEVRSDSQVIVQGLQDNNNGGSIMGCALMKRIRDLLEEPLDIKIVHVFREANRCADMLANKGSEGSFEIVYFDHPLYG
ncbi:hypothetical protein QL285_040194 [Trifolium repens]|nr:hypothetical protein QL285_040194 [Trifolium repens]